MKRILYTLLGMMLSVGAWAQTLQEQINSATDGSTITLTNDYTGQIVVPAASKLTLDLNGHKIEYTGTALINNGTLTIKDTGSNGKIVSTGNVGVAVGNNSTTTIESCIIESVEGAVITGTSVGTTITINGGTFSASDNAVIAGNGSARDGNANTITINGGTFNGQIKSSGYVACGIYAPWKDVITVNGGTFNITNGCGVLARAGSVTINGGVFNCTGTATGKVGDSRVVVPCSAVVYDSHAGYPAMTAESKIEVPTESTAKFTADPSVAAVSVVGESHIEISGGTYSSPLTEDVCADGYVPSTTPNADGTYGAAEMTYVAQIGDVKYATIEDAISAATDGQVINLLADVTVDKTLLVNQSSLTVDGNGKTIKSNVTSKLGTFYVNNKTCNLTIQNATIDGQNSASMAVCVYRGKANTTLDGTSATDNDNAENSVTLTNCTVKNFTGYPGSYVGAVYAFSHSHLTLNNCTFTGNTTSLPTNGASGADVWTGAATTVIINGGTYNEVFVNTNSSNVETVTINGGAKIEELAICVSYKADGSTNIPVLTIDNATVTNLTTEEGNPIPANEIILTNGGTITNMPIIEVAKILNGKSTQAFATLDDAITAANGAGKDVTITLLANATATVEPAANVTIDAASHALTLHSFNVTDGAELSYAKVTNATDNTYKVTTATYSRTGAVDTHWGTACLPFSFETAPAGYTLYTPTTVGDNALTVTEVTYPIAAGTPVIFYKSSAAETTMTITSSNASVKIDATPLAQSGSLALVGTFSQQNITEELSSIYYINGDQFHQAKASLTVPAYRAYIKNTSAGAKPRVLSIVVDEDATAVESLDANAEIVAIYDASGRQLTDPKKGLNIMKLSNGKTAKLFVK